MRRDIARAAGGLLFACGTLIGLPAAAQPEQGGRLCERRGVSIEVLGASDFEFATTCEGGDIALAFLDQCGISFDGSLRIAFEEDMREACGADTYATYTVADQTIRINSVPTCEAVFASSKLVGRVPFEEFFRSIVVHEVTHAVVDAVGVETAKKRLAQEYIASAVQYSTYDPEMVAQLKQDLLVRQHVALSDFTMAVYALSAEKFASMVITHFEGPDGGCRIIRDLLDGSRQMRESVHPD